MSSILILIPIALLIALRILSEGRKKRVREERAKLAEALAAASRSASPGAAEPVFDAHSLLPDDDEPPPPALPDRPKHYTIREAPSANTHPRTESFAAAERPVSGGSAHPSKETAPSDVQSQGLLSRLPPLKRAIALAEVLGPPKGYEP